MEFGLGETADAIRDTTARWAAERLAPRAAEIDEKNAFARDLWPEMGELGLHGITVEEEYGGSGLGVEAVYQQYRDLSGRYAERREGVPGAADGGRLKHDDLPAPFSQRGE